MPRSSNKQIAEDEHKIIQQLMEDSRQTPQEIAEKCGFSRQKVWRIINKLEETNTVWGYTAIIDDNHNDRNTYYALIKTKAPFIELIEKSIKKLTSKGHMADKLGLNLMCLCYINGDYDWILIFSAKNIRDAKVFVGFLQEEYGKHIERISLMDCVFPLIKFGKINPNIEQLKEFAIE